LGLANIALDGDQDQCHLEMMWPLWNVLDTTPDDRGDWYPPLGS